jgi:hypothetical protein
MPRRQTFPGPRASLAALLCLLSGAASAQPEGPPAQAAQPAAEPSTPVDPSILDTDNRSAQNNALAQEITPQSEEAVARGLAALAATQNPDGSFGEPSWGRRVAVTSIACLAFMADGNLPGRGAYGEVVSKGLDYVLSACTESGLISAEAANGPMYGHGFAALFLGEVYGMTGVDDSPLSRRLHEALLKAVRLIETTQNDEGGWRYNPVPNDADVSVTICQVMALRSARNAGIEVRKTTIDRAVDYVRRCQNPDGGFRYQAEGGPSAWPRSAAGVATLYYAGIYDDRDLSAGLDYLVQSALPGNNASQAHYYYGQYYAVQSMYLAGGQYWATWWPAIREELIQRQQPDGVWQDPSIGNIYGSSMALIVLQMPKRYLPIFQK